MKNNQAVIQSVWNAEWNGDQQSGMVWRPIKKVDSKVNVLHLT